LLNWFKQGSYPAAVRLQNVAPKVPCLALLRKELPTLTRATTTLVALLRAVSEADASANNYGVMALLGWTSVQASYGWSQTQGIRFRWEGFNARNLDRFNVQTASLSLTRASTFGNYTSLLMNPRVMQFALRHEFDSGCASKT
jgi:hypothetical protein